MGERLICCFTGHRRIRPEIMPELSALLDRVLDTLINDGVTEFRTGGAVGFDTLAALKVLEKRENGYRILDRESLAEKATEFL